jgi:hypothetical protein
MWETSLEKSWGPTHTHAQCVSWVFIHG